MIYLSINEIVHFYGPKTGGLFKGRFDAEKRSIHKSKQNWEYEFGYIFGLCAYAIIERKQKGLIDLATAASFRQLTGNGEWKLITALNPEKDTAQLQQMFDDRTMNLQYEYQPIESDRFKTKLYCIHQRSRQQLLIFHPKCKADPSEAASNPI